MRWCPVCPYEPPFLLVNDEFHVVAVCPGVADVRRNLGITGFFSLCQLYGSSRETAFQWYLQRRDSKGEFVDTWQFLERGKDLAELQKAWLSLWS